MARPSKSAAIDYTIAHDLTHGLLERAACPNDKAFVLVKDSAKKGLRLRATRAGGKHWQFETRVKGRLFTRALGEWPTVSIFEARALAHDLRGLTEKGIDPRVEEKKQKEELADHQAAMASAAVARALTVGEVWPLYLKTGRPKRKDAWKPRYRADLLTMAGPGGEKKKRGQGVTRPGPLFPLMSLRLANVNEDTLTSWFENEALSSKQQATRALMMFNGFLRWCAARPEYRKLIDRNAGKAAAIMENLPRTTRRTDALEAAQVASWWGSVENLSNRTASTYLRALLLTGARREELASLTWTNVDFLWFKLTIADKIDATRTIPLTPYLSTLLASLPRLNNFVFASVSKSGRIVDVRSSHSKALQAAGIGHLSLHGLRRSFSLLGEAAGAPEGAIAQVMGHRPSGTAEGYRPRSIDALRPYLHQIEVHILTLVGRSLEIADAPVG